MFETLDLILAMVAFWFGAIYLFDKGRAWEWHVRREKRRGIEVTPEERTPEWERRQTYYGVAAVVMGILFLVYASAGSGGLF
jgi:hypothetical protein